MTGRILILWEDSFSVHKEAVEAVRKLMDMYPVRLCIDTMFSSQKDISYFETGNQYVEDYYQDMESLINGCNGVFIPYISKRLITELKWMNYDSPFCCAVMMSICRNIRVWTPCYYGFEGHNPFINAEMNKNKLLLKNLGIEFIDLKNISHLVPSKPLDYKKRIITENDVIELNTKGINQLQLLQMDVLTPLAADYLKEKNIIVIRSD